MLSRWAAAEFSTDWGVRDISDRTPFYDPISYHQGSVWPLFTGWVSLAEYRAGRALAGYAHLMQNAGLTWTQDLGAVTELLSGEFFEPLGRSSSHQVWSSAMVLTPALRGLFGLEWDAPRRTLRVAPHLPAGWDGARLHNVPLGNLRLELEYRREGGRLVVRASSASAEQFCLVAQDAARDFRCEGPAVSMREIALPARAVEIGIARELPMPGARTEQLKVVGERDGADRYEVEFEAPGGSRLELAARVNRANVRAIGGELAGDRLRLQFPPGDGYRRVSVVFTW
jgi:hypothetical protein